MKSKLFIIVLFLSMMLLVGCRSNEAGEDVDSGNSALSEETSENTMTSESEIASKEDITREVVFYNKKYSDYLVGVVIQQNHMVSLYQEDSDASKLYAFEVSIEYYKNGDFDYSEDYSSTIVSLLHKEGLLIIKDYPDDSIVVAGTMEEIKRVFEETDNLDGWCLRAVVAVRLDREPVEGEESQVTLTVPVIMPEEVLENK